MIFRIRFAKYGVVKFIGHLDVMRYFQKAVRRSGLPIKYSQGFNPHQLMVFAQPLGVGVTSDGEYMDIETEDNDFEGNSLNAERVREILGGALTEGFEIVSIREIPWIEGTKHPENAMALVKGADYIMSLKDGYELHPNNEDAKALDARLKEFLEKDTITVSKKSKSGERDMDIRPYIYEAAVVDNSEIPDFMYADKKSETDDKTCFGTVHADVYAPGIRFFFRLSAGSEVNIKPELVLDAFLEFCGLEHDEFAFQIHRANMYSDVGAVLGL
jgi:radical SAM-linked protein